MTVSRKAKRHADAAKEYRARQEYARARSELERALAVIGRGPPLWSSPLTRLRWALADVDLRSALGEVGLDQGRPDLARRDLEMALHKRKMLDHAESTDVTTLLNNLGVAYEKLGDYDAAVSCLQRALAIDRRTGRSPDALAVELTNLAYAYMAAGDHAAAARVIDEATGLAGVPVDVSQRLEQERGNLLLTAGEYAEGLAALTRQLDVLRQYERDGVLPTDSVEKATCLGNIGQAYAELLRWAEAERFQYEEVAIRRRRLPDSMPLAIALSNLANTLGSQDRVTEAADRLREAVEMARLCAPHSQPLAAMRGRLASLLVELGDPHAALALAEQAIADAPSANRYLLAAHLAAATAYDRLGDPDRANGILEDGVQVCRRISPVLPELRPLLSLLGMLAWERGDLDAAADRFDEAILVAEHHRVGSALEPGLELLFGTAKTAYHGRIAVAYERGASGDAEAAFHAAESFRARTLAELVTAAPNPHPPAPDPPAPDPHPPAPAVDAVAAELRMERARLSAVYQRLAAMPDMADSPQERQRRLEERVEHLRLMLRASTSEAAKRWYPSPCTVADVQCRLGKGTMLALYEVTGDHVYVWAVRHDRLTFTRLDADPARLKLAAEEVVAACRAEGPEPDEALRWLGEWLLRPVLGDGGPAVDDLALCVNDILAYLPFEALPLDGTPLVDRCVTRLVPSATTLVQFGIRPRTREPVADFAGFAVRRTAGMLDLPAALREIERVAELFPPPAVVLADEQATVAAVRAHASAHRYVHFATHGVIHDGRPLYSGLPLAPTADGYEFLPAYEMFSLDLCADVVVCSACDTAIGDSRTGEGVVGLSYALFAGGARSVVLSRWPVHDAVGPWFMRAFYSALTGGAAVAAALRHAALASRERYRTPHAWAAFLLLDTALPGTDGVPAGPDDRQ